VPRPTLRHYQALGTIYDSDINAVDDVAYTGFEYPVDLYVLDNDTDMSYGNFKVESIVSGPSFGSVEIVEYGYSLTYTPDATFTSGSDTFTYEVIDEEDGHGEAEVTINMVDVTDYSIEWETPDEAWETIGEDEAMWWDENLRWTAEFSPEDPPTASGIEWEAKAWADRDDDSVAWEVFAETSTEDAAEGNPGTGDWAVQPSILFDWSSAQSGFRAAMAVLKRIFISEITDVEWKGVDANDGENNLEEYPVGSGEYRIFPERNHPEGAEDPPGTAIDGSHDKVEVKVTVAPPVPANCSFPVYLKVFDPDHLPDEQDAGEANTAADGDPNDHTAGTHTGDDNLGSTGSGMSPAAGQITIGAGQDNGVLELTIDEPQPGNNFIVVANGRQSVPTNYRFKADGKTLERPANPWEDVPAAVQTPMLTVWRTLWMERDSMEAPISGIPPNGEGPFTGPGVDEDDVEFDPHSPAITVATTNYQDALVRVLELPPATYDVTDDVDFVHNLPIELTWTKGNPKRDVSSKCDFWVIHLVGGYEGHRKEEGVPASENSMDADPNTENGLVGYDVGKTADEPCFVFLETIRDLAVNVGATADPGMSAEVTYENRVALHESLHQFLGMHSDPNVSPPKNPVADEAIMNYTIMQYGTAAQCKLTPRQILVINGTDYPGDSSPPETT